MNNFKLIAAYCYLQLNVVSGLLITGIEFEDGRGDKFNYCVNGKWNFIDLTGKL